EAANPESTKASDLDWVLSDDASQSAPAEGDDAPPAEEIVLSTPDEDSSTDLQLREIYSRETKVNIAAVLRWVEAERKNAGPHVVSEECYRACHTLAGS